MSSRSEDGAWLNTFYIFTALTLASWVFAFFWMLAMISGPIALFSASQAGPPSRGSRTWFVVALVVDVVGTLGAVGLYLFSR